MTIEEFIVKLPKMFTFDQGLADELFDKVDQLYQDNINAGLEPGLNPKYAEYKIKYGKPPTPLYWDGTLKGSLTQGEVTESKIEIVNTSPVKLSWHMGDNRAPGVPKRNPLPPEAIVDMAKVIIVDYIKKVLNG